MREPDHRAVAVVFAVVGATFGGLSARIPWIQHNLELSTGELGLALLFSPVGAFVAMPTAGRIAHRLGGRRTTRLLLVLSCAAPLPVVLAPSLPWLAAVFFLEGVITGMCDIGMNAQGVVVERRLRRPIMSGLHGMWSVGCLAGAGIGALAAQAGVTAPAHLGLVAAAYMPVGVALTRALPATWGSRGEAAPPRFAVPPRKVLLVGLVGFCAVFAEGAGNHWAAVYVTDVTAAGPGVAAAAYAVFAMAMALARLAGDGVVRRFGPVASVRAGAVLAAVGLVTVAVARTPVPAIGGFALLGTGIAVIVPLVVTAAGNAASTTGQGVAGAAGMTYLSYLLAPAVTGWLADLTSLPVAFGLIACVTAALVPFARLLRAAAGHGGPADGAHDSPGSSGMAKVA
ncbi:MFS transporter [Thermostaphylospora chromogena]|uniref:Sugar phosphate permease n=1 Tax=Thermostaphylospora chromogena TaxID=35622 RepID=A0A1H1GUF3_9ACTN|nr:MFS transporter [Thermostaphylospora chromogena]SDR16548.1 Sugar phosphate permease [Thermostaphylospora chromogena]